MWYLSSENWSLFEVTLCSIKVETLEDINWCPQLVLWVFVSVSAMYVRYTDVHGQACRDTFRNAHTSHCTGYCISSPRGHLLPVHLHLKTLVITFFVILFLRRIGVISSFVLPLLSFCCMSDPNKSFLLNLTRGWSIKSCAKNRGFVAFCRPALWQNNVL